MSARRALPFVVAAVLAAGPAVAADVTWAVTEGGQYPLRGIWHVTFKGDTVAGHAEMMTSSGQKVTYHVQGKRQGGELVLERGNPSDRTACAYRGKLAEQGKITGVALCGKTPSSWVAIKR